MPTVSELNTQKLNAVFPVSRETLDRLEHFVRLFEKWSRAINLVAPSTLPDIWNRHILDSLQLYALNSGAKHWVDLGSGGGFPGIITAILLLETDGGHVDLIESNQKKAAFLRQALLETGAKGAVHAVRIEEASQKLNGYDAISARAVASLDALLAYSANWMAQGATAWFHKGRDYQTEIEKARGGWDFDLVKHPGKVDADSIILEISNLSRRN